MMKNGWLMAVAAAVAMAGTAWGESVDKAVAEAVALEAVEQFFPGEAWTVADGVEVKDGEGERAAWAFVFANGEFGGGVAERLAAGEDGTDGESELYAGTATVVTGAKDTDSLVFRTFRGLAEWYQEGVKSGWKGEAVQVGPGDIRWAPEIPAGARAVLPAWAAVRKLAKARAAAAEEERDGWDAERRDAEVEAQAEAEAAAKARWGAAKEHLLKAE